MSNQLEICNMAISHCRGSRITSITEDSQEAQACNDFFQVCLDFMFADTEWNFLEAFMPLTEIVNDDSSSNIHYFAYPANASKVFAVARSEYASYEFFQNNSGHSEEFKIMQGETDKVIIANIDNLTAYYQKNVDDVTQLSPPLVLALSHLLSGYIAMPVLGGDEARKIESSSNRKYQMYLASARTHDASQQKVSRKHTPMLDHYDLDK